MLQAALHSGAAHRRSVFQAFARGLPAGRRYGIVAGTGRLLEGIANFRFGEDELDFLGRTGVVNEETLDYLAAFRFSGDIWGYPEGEAYFPNSPVLIVESTFAEACILETYVLSVLNHDSAIASAASRMISAAGGRPCIEMGSRRTHEESAAAAARAAVIAGLCQHVQPGGRTALRPEDRRHRRPLLHPAPRLRARRLRGAARLARAGHHAAGGHVRRRSGRPHRRRPRRRQTGRRPAGLRRPRGPGTVGPRTAGQLGNEHTRIVVTSDLDEFAVAALAVRPGGFLRRRHVAGDRVRGADGRAWSTSWSAGPTTPASSSAVAKTSKNKTSMGGRKYAAAQLNDRGTATHEILGVGHPPEDDGNDRPLLQQFIKNGELLPGLDGPGGGRARAPGRHADTMAELPRGGQPAAARRAGHPHHLRGGLNVPGPDHR